MNSAWIIDSGATNNMTYDRCAFSNLSFSFPKLVITNANGVSSPIVDTVSLSSSLSVTDTLFVSSQNCNLMSVSQLTKSHNLLPPFFLLIVFFRTSIPRKREEDCTIWMENFNNQWMVH